MGLRAGFTGLLDDIGGGAIACSLRKLSKTSPVNALRIRRASDNVEVDVQFDHSNVVSTDSPITNVSGEGSGTLSIGTAWSQVAGSAGYFAATPLTVGGTYATPFKARVSLGETVVSGSTVNLTGSVSSISGSNWVIYPAQSDNSIAVSSGTSITSTGVFVTSFTLTADADYVIIENTSGSENITLSGAVTGSKSAGDTAATTLGAFIAEASSPPDMHVVTWYDQSGNGNHFSNSTISTQPKIVDYGTYLGHIDFDADAEKLENTSISGIPAGDQSFHIVQAERSVPDTGFNITFYNPSFSHYTYYQNSTLVAGFSVGSAAGGTNTVGEFNQFSVLGSLSPNQQITTRNTLTYSSGGGVSGDPPALTIAQFGDGTPLFVNSLFKIKEFVFLNTVDSDIVSEVSSNQTTYFGTPD